LKEQLRFSVAYWHTFRNALSGPFGVGTAIRKDGRLAEFVEQRCASWDSGIGAKIEAGKEGLAELESYRLKQGEAVPNVSGRQEFLENLINEFI
jgi:xylose isomerase